MSETEINNSDIIILKLIWEKLFIYSQSLFVVTLLLAP